MAAGEVDKLSTLLAGTKVEDGVLSFAGRAIKLDNTAAATEIVDAIKNKDTLKTLVLQGNTMGVEAARLIGDAIAEHKELERAQFSDMFTGRMKTELPPALEHLGHGIMKAGASLVELDLSDNAFGQIGVEAISKLLSSTSCYSLQELKLNNNGLGPNGGKVLAAVLDKAYEASITANKPLALKVFVSGRGRLENEGATALSHVFKKMGSLEYVSMPQNGINSPGITALAHCFAFNPNLRHLNLGDNTFTVSGADAFAQALPKLTKLEVLNLESCLIRTRGAKAIAKALDGDFPHLQEINCNYNEISQSGAVSLVENAALLPSIKSLQIDGNNLGEGGKEVVHSTLEATGKMHLVPSLSEDEGTEDDEEDEEDEDSAEEVEGDSYGSAAVVQVTPQEYMRSPAIESVGGIDRVEWSSCVKQELSSLSDEVDLSDRTVYLCLRLASPLTVSTSGDIKHRIFTLCDEVFHVVSTRKPSPAVICNSILVNLGLIKGENKKFKLPSENLTGPLLAVEHIVQQDYFPTSCVKILHFYLSSQPEKKLEKFFQAKHQLLQTLFTL